MNTSKPLSHAGQNKPRTPSRSERNISVNEMMAGIFRSVEKATGKNLVMDPLQHATTPDECRQWLETVKAMFTDREGKLNKKEYCKALNSVRNNLLFTVKELEQAIADANRSGNTETIPGFEVMIERYETNAGILAEEIQKNGGKVG